MNAREKDAPRYTIKQQSRALRRKERCGRPIAWDLLRGWSRGWLWLGDRQWGWRWGFRPW